MIGTANDSTPIGDDDDAHNNVSSSSSNNSNNDEEDVSAVLLTKDQILTWSSLDLDRFIGNIIKQRQQQQQQTYNNSGSNQQQFLTYAEEKAIAKQRRSVCLCV